MRGRQNRSFEDNSAGILPFFFASHGVRGPVRDQISPQMLFNFCGRSEVCLRELHANTGLSVTLRALWGHPNNGSVDGHFLRLIHQCEQDEYFFT